MTVRYDDKHIYLKSEYNKNLVEACHRLAGNFISNEWVFPLMVKDRVEKLDQKYETNKVTIIIKAKYANEGSRGSLFFQGKPLAIGYDKKSGAKLGSGIAQLKGSVGTGGSVNNWYTYCTSGSVFMFEISQKLIDSMTEAAKEKWEILKEYVEDMEDE